MRCLCFIPTFLDDKNKIKLSESLVGGESETVGICEGRCQTCPSQHVNVMHWPGWVHIWTIHCSIDMEAEVNLKFRGSKFEVVALLFIKPWVAWQARGGG